MDQKPSLGRIVLVKTHGEPINSQDEHAAIITQVWSDVCINTTIFPGSGAPFVRTSVEHESRHEGELPKGAVTWRWPPRV